MGCDLKKKADQMRERYNESKLTPKKIIDSAEFNVKKELEYDCE